MNELLRIALEELKPEDKSALVSALNQGNSHLVKLADNRFVGVHLVASKSLKVVESQGAWSYGEINDQ